MILATIDGAIVRDVALGVFFGLVAYTLLVGFLFVVFAGVREIAVALWRLATRRRPST